MARGGDTVEELYDLVAGQGRRSAGVVDDPAPLTAYDPDHPYYANEYDLADRG